MVQKNDIFILESTGLLQLNTGAKNHYFYLMLFIPKTTNFRYKKPYAKMFRTKRHFIIFFIF